MTAGLQTAGWLPGVHSGVTHCVLPGAQTVPYEYGVAYLAVCGARSLPVAQGHPWGDLPPCELCAGPALPTPRRSAARAAGLHSTIPAVAASGGAPVGGIRLVRYRAGAARS